MGQAVVRRSPLKDALNPDDAPYIIGGLVATALVLLTFGYLLGLAALDVWAAIIVALVLIAFSAPALRWVSRKEQDPGLYRILYGALCAKLAMSMVRFFVIFVVYAGNGDAGMYHEAGTTFARRLRDGIPIHPLPNISSFPKDTQLVGDVTGVLYTLTSPSAYAGFLCFSYLCFWGQVLAFRGLKVAVPEADSRRFAVLVLFLPSLLFWPSSVGKEALMVGLLGFVIYGAGLLLAPKPQVRGFAFFAFGAVSISFFRPHISLMAVGALVVAVAVGTLMSGTRGTDVQASGRGRAVRLAALGGLIVVASFVGTQFTGRFESAENGGESSTTSKTLEGTLAATSQGGSEFKPITILSPVQIPLGVPSVIFRPFVWEASSVNSLIAAVEGLVLITIFATSWRRLAHIPKLLARRPFLVFVTAFVLVFATGFSFIANFGILARQRTQMMAMVLVFVSMAPLPKHQIGSRRRRSQVDSAEQPTTLTAQVRLVSQRTGGSSEW